MNFILYKIKLFYKKIKLNNINRIYKIDNLGIIY